MLLLGACSADYGSIEQYIATPLPIETSRLPSETLNNSADSDVQQGFAPFAGITYEIMSRFADEIRSEFNFNVDISAIIIDIKNNRLIVSYGDANKFTNANYVFWPISAAIMVSEYGLDTHNEFDNTPYVLVNGYEIWSAIPPSRQEEFYVGRSSLFQGILDSNFSAFYHAFQVEDPSLFFNLLEKLNLERYVERPDIDEMRLYMRPIVGDLLVSPLEIALLYSAIANGGRLFADVDTCEYKQVFDVYSTELVIEVLNYHMESMDNNWNTFALIREMPFFESFRSQMIGNVSSHFGFNNYEANIWGGWFVGLYPAEAPAYLMVINTSYCSWDAMDSHRDYPYSVPRVFPGPAFALAMAYHVYEYFVSEAVICTVLSTQ